MKFDFLHKKAPKVQTQLGLKFKVDDKTNFSVFYIIQNQVTDT